MCNWKLTFPYVMAVFNFSDYGKLSEPIKEKSI